MTKKAKIIFIIVLVLLVVFVILRAKEDTWLCQKGEWVKHGVPSAPRPEGKCSWLNNFNPF